VDHLLDERNIPPTMDFEHALAAPLVRQGLLRVTTGLSKQSELAFAVEESDPEILIPTGVQGAPEKTWPDLTARFRLTSRMVLAWDATEVPRAPRWMPPADWRPWTSSASLPDTSTTGAGAGHPMSW